MDKKKILIIDDDVAVTNYFKVSLTQSGIFDIVVKNDSRQVAELWKRDHFDVVLLDMDMPNISGLDILKDIHQKELKVPVVVLTGVGDVDLAVNAMKLGAFDYLIKPVEDEKLLEVLLIAMEHRDLHHTIDQLSHQLTRQDLTHEAVFDQFPTRDPKMIRVLHQAEKIAASDLSVFLWGERGTGKESLARAIHLVSPRADRPFVAVDADSRIPDKFPAFFFGQARRWSSSEKDSPGIMEQAHLGTLFLDNIESLTLPLQVRLKRAIQTGEYCRESSAQVRQVNVRIIVSSTHDLTSKEYETNFSRDLLYHLMINPIKIPALRERIEDIELLANHFLKEQCQKTGKKLTGFSAGFFSLLKKYHFPDNVQELGTIIATAVAAGESDTITEEYLPPYIKNQLTPQTTPFDKSFEPRPLDDIIKEHVLDTLKYYGQDIKKAAEKLKISPDEITRIIKDN